jgi:ABC-2 type transport system ATP-binding protein
MTGLALEAQKLGKNYGRHLALEALDLAIAPGEIVALIGENGAGKTTAVAMLSGQLVPSAGRALIGGHDVYRAPIAARRVLGYVAQDLLLPPHLTVFEMAEMACSLKELSLDQKQLARLLEATGLSSDKDRLIGELSHGMQRKTAWVVALLTKPKILLLDEGLAGLDAVSSAWLSKEIVRRAKTGMGILWIEHSLELVAPELARVIVLHRGKVAETIAGDTIRDYVEQGTLLEKMRTWTAAGQKARTAAAG